MSCIHFLPRAELIQRRIEPSPELPLPSFKSGHQASCVEETAPRRRRILLVDDNVLNRRLASRMLQRQGFDVRIVENGRQALEWLEQDQFDAVLMDTEMPEMNGPEVAASLRLREQRQRLISSQARHTPIIALIADLQNGDRERCRSAGMDVYVSKPVRAG